ncbi:MAG: hypothetical protein IKZ98_15005 [Clostridia bacterium]|nr:hypothetical protein [Clostridia bacterium]
MLKKTFVLILAACILLSTASFAESESKETQAPADEIIYTSEYLTVRMGAVAVEEDSITVPLSFDVTGRRSCVMTSDFTEEMLTGMDIFEALNNLKQINGRKAFPQAAPGETIECCFTWNSTESYNYSFVMDILEKIGFTLEPETVELELESFPKSLTAGLTILLSEPEADITVTWPIDAEALLDASNYDLIRLRFISAD